jgi:hypothetical protein
MSNPLKDFQEAQRQQEVLLDAAVEAARQASRRRADEFLDWAIRRATPNPKFDEDWTV